MKLFVASDIHGSSFYCRKLLERFDAEQADRILLLGDVLYHGPRNDLPDEYSTKPVAAMLNERSGDIFAVRGNCDSEVDQMVLDFPIMADYCVVSIGNKLIYATHGHIFGENNPPLLHSGDILLCGHTHVPACRKHPADIASDVSDASRSSAFSGISGASCDPTVSGTGFIYMNPGSVSIPKENSWHGYMIIDEAGCIWKDLEGMERMRYCF